MKAQQKKKRSQTKRLQDATDVYYQLHGPKPFTMEQVAEWMEANKLLPVPTIHDCAGWGEQWDKALDELRRGDA